MNDQANTLSNLYRPSLALLTDLYQLTMAYGYWKLGRTDEEAIFHLFFRKPPFGGGYAIACGMSQVVGLLNAFAFEQDDLDYLATLAGSDGKPLFDARFLEYLKDMRLSVSLDAVPEGTLVFANEPMLRVQGPLIQCQLLETVLLNLVNFPTLIATKAARVCQAAQGDPVLEFGLRRAQGIDGSLTASRAAFIGGCAATSNVLAGRLYGIPVKGTHAHSWVMSFDEEEEAFEAYAKALPNNCVFLVDTYDTEEGVRRAISAGKSLVRKGHRLMGIRLDSGDLAGLSAKARNLLDMSGFKDAIIVASNDLDEYAIEELKKAKAPIAMWGVGTKLVTAYDQPALGGVYKLAGLRKPGGAWLHKVKRSEDGAKTSIPGRLQIRRFFRDGKMAADMIYDELTGTSGGQAINPHTPELPIVLDARWDNQDLLAPIFKEGRDLGKSRQTLEQIRTRAANQLEGLDLAVRRNRHPEFFPVGLEPQLYRLRERLIGQYAQN